MPAAALFLAVSLTAQPALVSPTAPAMVPPQPFSPHGIAVPQSIPTRPHSAFSPGFDSAPQSRDAVEHLPQIRDIEHARRGQPDPSGNSNSDQGQRLQAIFDAPAHFAVPGFDRYGLPISQDAAVIYEGMTVEVSADGTYEVRFVVETPRTPVTLRMQLHVMAPNDVECPTLTLAPVTLEAGNGNSRHESAQLRSVRSRGYSDWLRRNYRQISLEGPRVTRTGTARFGSLPE